MPIDLTRFDFHVVRFLNSEDVEQMTSDEVGQYVLLLCKSWITGSEASLPDDLKYLAKQARCKKVSPLVLKKFPVIETPTGNRRRNKVLYGEWLLARERSLSASERGKRGNEARWSDRYSETDSDTVAVATSSLAKSPNQPVPINPSKPYQPNQSSVSFDGGSFGQGNWKFISSRWYMHFKKTLSGSKQNKEQYASACSTYGEDRLLEYLEEWAKSNDWVAAHPKGNNRLYRFLQDLPALVEGDEMRKEREEAKKEPKIDLSFAEENIEKTRQDFEQRAAAIAAQEAAVTNDPGF